jgi:hypothetical protein
VVETHVRRYPLMQAEDLYKLAHQAAFGPGHAVDDPDQARTWLLAEVERLAARSMAEETDEPLIEALRPDRSVVRVHLRPYFEAGLDTDELAAAFARSAAEHRPAPEVFERYRRCFEELAEDGDLDVDRDSLSSYLDRRAAEGLPAVHHSDEYVRAYRPAYRVVLLETLPIDP